MACIATLQHLKFQRIGAIFLSRCKHEIIEWQFWKMSACGIIDSLSALFTGLLPLGVHIEHLMRNVCITSNDRRLSFPFPPFFSLTVYFQLCHRSSMAKIWVCTTITTSRHFSSKSLHTAVILIDLEQVLCISSTSTSMMKW